MPPGCANYFMCSSCQSFFSLLLNGFILRAPQLEDSYVQTCSSFSGEYEKRCQILLCGTQNILHPFPHCWTENSGQILDSVGFCPGSSVWLCSLLIWHGLFWWQLERKRRGEILKGQVQTWALCFLPPSFDLQVLLLVQILKDSFHTLRSDVPQSLILRYPKDIFIFPSGFVSILSRFNKQFKHC